MSSQAKKKNIEAIYPLSPMQQGMLFHYVYNPESATYFEQFQAKFKGDLNVSAFQEAWQILIQRHAVLRTSFVWKKLDKMLQVVQKEVEFPFELMDWRSLDPAEQEKRFQQFMAEDRKKGFDLAKAPLLRLYLIRLDEDVYQFLWSFHHLLTDGWSIPIILKEFLLIYEMKCKNIPVQLPPTRPYRDYINWLQKQDMNAARNYWRNVLKDWAGPSLLTIGRPQGYERDVEDTYEKIVSGLSKSTSEKLFQLAKQNNVTLSSFVQTAWAIVLSRYNKTQDVVFGATVSGRPPELSGVEEMVGLFINTIPVRVFVDERQTAIELVKQVQQQAVQSREFEYTPLVEIKSLVDIPRDLPLFDTIVVFENYPTDTSLKEQKGSLELLESGSYERTNFPITFVAAASDRLSLEIAYENRRFDPQLMEQLLKHVTHILEQMANAADLPLTHLRLVDEDEMQHLITNWNLTTTPFEDQLTIHEKFEQIAEQFPERTALVYNDEALSYLELNSKANQLAHFLIERGVSTEILVGICMDRSPEMIISQLAVLKAGGAFVPMDPHYPSERLKFMINDSQIKLLLTHSRVRDRIPDAETELLVLDEIQDKLNTLPRTNPGQRVHPENLAYIIYTSGSTGQPKGVLLAHRGVLNLKDAAQKTVFVSDEVQRIFQFASISFDASIFEIFGALLNGHELHLTDRETILSIEKLTEFIESHRITFLSLPPSMYAILPAEKIKSPKICISAGEACSWQIVEKWAPGRRFINGYGPTEATVGCTWQVVEATHRAAATPPIGNAIQNTQIYIVDEHLHPVPVGMPGELCIAGVGLARGYWQRPELTAEKFVPNPFSSAGGRLYRTGDLVRRLPDGSIEFLGRIDFQVKLRGFRIELGEIETALRQINGITDAAVILREDTPGNKYLAAYYITKDGSPLPAEELSSQLKQRLPEYMVPAAFVHLEHFPLTPNGKVNRRALPKPDEQQMQTQAKTAPRTPVEELLASIWADILKTENIGANDNFFDLGGHSLSATQLVSRIRNAFDVEIPIKTIFEFPVLEDLAFQIETLKLQDKTLQAPPIEPVPRDQDIPLSFSQQRLWFLDKLASGSANYNIPTAIRLKGQLNVPVLERCIQTLIQRHETLRTTFSEKDGEPVQIIHPHLDFKLPMEDFSALPETEALNKARQLAAEDAGSPFDLIKGPLFRIRLIKLAEQDHVVLFNLHHTITDGWSMGILVKEVAQLYQAFSQNQPSPLPDLQIQYADYAVWQRNWLKGETLQKHLDFWKEFLGMHPPALELPTDFPRPAMQTFNGRTIKEVLPKDLSRQIVQFSRKEGVTLFMTLLAAFQTLLYRYSNQRDILVGSPIANRTRTETENLIGFFVNTLVFKAQFEPEINFKNLLKQIRENSLKIYAHQDVPFEQIVEALQPERDLSRSPLFQVAFILQNAPFEGMQLPDLALEPFEAENPTSKYDLTLNTVETPEGIECYLEFNTDLFAEQTARRLLKHFRNLLNSVVEDAKQPLTAIDFLTEEEKNLILKEWNNTERAFPDGTTVHHLFEELAGQQPNRLAIQYFDQKLTYQELNSKANQLAHHLIKLGVQRDEVVGFSLHRGPNVPIAMLAILKAGAGFLSIDPTYPPERIDYMLQDSGLRFLITDAQIAGHLSVTGKTTILLDEESQSIAQMPETNPNVATDPQNLAYVIYTSGSTGKPKGTLLPHRGLCNLAKAQQRAFNITPESRILQFSSLSFDASVWETVMALLNGATLVLADQASISDGLKLTEVLREQKITTITLPPSVLAVMPEVELPHLQTIITAGEKCTLDLVKRWAHGRQFVNAYGPTETTVCASMFEVQPDLKIPPPIGKPIDNFKLYITDPYGNLTPIGVPGELCISGVGLARGYLNRPDLTAEKFIPDAFSGISGQRLYRSGDLVRWLPDGNIEFLGRIDHQVKLRGFRIELGEIEATLLEKEEIRDSAVIVFTDKTGESRLVGYYVTDSGQPLNHAELKSFLKQKLPEYMVPTLFVHLEAMPLTPNGKVDRKALPEPELTRDISKEYVAPRNETEQVLTSIVAELLGLEKVGVFDNFFDLGGHSLLATKFVTRVQQELKIDLPLKLLFEKPTVAELATAISEMELPQMTESIEHIERDEASLDELLSELDNLSEEEVQQMLEQEKKKDVK